MSQLRRVATVATVCCSAAQETFAVSQAALDALKAANGIPVDDVSGSGISNSGSRMVEVEAQSTAVHSGFCGLKLKWSWWGARPYYIKCSSGLSCTGYTSGICLNDPRTEGEPCGSDWTSTTSCAVGLYCDSQTNWASIESGVCKRYLESRIWVQTEALRPAELPEATASSRVKSHLQSGATTGVAISGGGSRSYAAAIGYIRGLHELDLLKDVTYVSGTSGGGWFTTILSYYKSQPSALSLTDALGEYRAPESSSILNLSPNFAAGQFGISCTTDVFKSLGNILSKGVGKGFPHLWREVVSSAYLQPFGLDQADTRYTWDLKTAQSIEQRNRNLQGSKWHFADKDGPFPIITGMQIGPHDLAPYAKFDFTLNEFTPLYSGSPGWRKIQYSSESGSGVAEVAVGGYVEPFAFGSEAVGSGRDNAISRMSEGSSMLVGSAKVVPRENSESDEKGVMAPLSTIFGITSNWGNKWTGCQQSDFTCLLSNTF